MKTNLLVTARKILGLLLIYFFALPNHAAIDKAILSFKSPDEAVQKLVEAIKANDMDMLVALFGPEAKSIIESGDTAYDDNNRKLFIEAYELTHELKKTDDNTLMLAVGKSGWQFPVPLIKKADAWQFDLAAGKEEIQNRIIGRNELSTIQALLAYVDAQREYFALNPEKHALPRYAQKFMSTEGKRDGLYFPVEEGEQPSPLGELYAKAQNKFKDDPVDKQRSYHGYNFRILQSQGPDAAGGAFDYLVKDAMFGGHAVIARPADYDRTGVMTFIVNHDGVIFEKDLGEDTEKLADEIMSFNPDKSWRRVNSKFRKELSADSDD